MDPLEGTHDKRYPQLYSVHLAYGPSIRMAPGVQQSDQNSRDVRIGGGGTDEHLRHYLIEATFWACRVPRYRPTYERILYKRGPKIARVVVARMMLRSIYKMLQTQARFNRLRVA